MVGRGGGGVGGGSGDWWLGCCWTCLRRDGVLSATLCMESVETAGR